MFYIEAKLEGMERNGLVKTPGENLMDKTTIVLQEIIPDNYYSR